MEFAKSQLIILLFSSAAFLYYGLACILTDRMKVEFNRYGLSRQRVLTGSLQIVGAIGLLLSLFYPFIGMLAAGGLTLLMILGFAVRLKIRDGVLATLPSLFFMGLNGYLFYLFL